MATSLEVGVEADTVGAHPLVIKIKVSAMKNLIGVILLLRRRVCKIIEAADGYHIPRWRYLCL